VTTFRNPFRRELNAEQQRVADRLPPGQYLTQKWPVLHYGGVPRVDLATWRFVVDGLVENPLQMTYTDVQQFPRKTIRADIHCVTRWSLLVSSWEGIPVEEIVRRAQPKAEATHVLVHAAHGYTTNLALEDFLHSENMLVDRRDGEIISPEHGWPLRLLVPHLYFWKSAKWVTGFEFLSHDQPGFWEGYGYHNHGDPWREERFG
jgi:DMSO/TMAO reductase YedYZ molybdopterin-dependent catalytic subunit